MRDQFTPTTEQVRDGYRFDPEAEYRDPTSAGHLAIMNGYAFDRWLARVKREAAADAWDEGAKWAAVELGAIRDERNEWLTPGDNPYRDFPEMTS